MATLTSGGKITGQLGLTCARQVGYDAVVGDVVYLTASYTVNKVNSVAGPPYQIPIGQIIVQNKRRGVTTTDDVTVEARGDHVDILVAGGTVAVGPVKIDATGRVVQANTEGDAQFYGIALNSATVGLSVDVMPL